MKYKAGDYVIINPNLRVGGRYGKYSVMFVRGMRDEIGKIQQIKCVQDFGEMGFRYTIEGSDFFWVDEMIICSIPYSDNLLLDASKKLLLDTKYRHALEETLESIIF